jgi:DNA-binding NtrC family response regulator
MSPLDKIKIFLVDDDAIFTKALALSLSTGQADVRTFSSGEECLKSLNENPQIIVLDYSLNNCLNGIQILNRIKQSSPDTEVIMLSNTLDTVVQNDTLKYGAYDFIEKGENAIYRLKKDIKYLCDKLQTARESEKENNRLLWVNAAIILVIVLIFILTHIK